jgi:hypothetical protein
MELGGRTGGHMITPLLVYRDAWLDRYLDKKGRFGCIAWDGMGALKRKFACDGVCFLRVGEVICICRIAIGEVI